MSVGFLFVHPNCVFLSLFDIFLEKNVHDMIWHKMNSKKLNLPKLVWFSVKFMSIRLVKSTLSQKPEGYSTCQAGLIERKF